MSPAPPDAGTSGGWRGLLNTFIEQGEMAREDKQAEPVECFYDGEPLTEGPNGELHCRYCGDLPRT